VRATAEAVRVGGWAAAAGLLAFTPLSAFFLLNAVSFFASAALIAPVRARGRAQSGAPPRMREGFAALRPRPVLAVAVAAVAVGMTISSGTWMVGVPQLVRSSLGLGAGSFAAVAAGYAVGAVIAGIVLSQVEVKQKARTSFILWIPYAAAYTLFAVAHSLATAVLAGACSGAIQAAVMILVYSAAQEEVPDALLGRVVGLISLVHRGAHATGLLFIGPLFAAFAPRTVFLAATLSLPLVGVAAAAAARGRAPR
jgi:hypothetical protein